MTGQGSTEPDIFASENIERSFAQDLYLWFRDHAWLGTAAELFAELKARTGLEGECWPENPQALCSQLEGNTELLRSYGLEISICQQDNGPRLISIRPLGETPGLATKKFQADSPRIRHESDDKNAFAAETNDLQNTNGEQEAKERIGTEEQALAESVDSQATPSTIRASNNDHQREPAADFPDSSDWNDIRKSLKGFDTANSVPTGIAHRIVITGIVILSFLDLLVLFAWLWPASFPVALFARSTGSQSNSALVTRFGQDADQGKKAPEATNQESNTPNVSHGELVSTDAGARDTVRMVPEGVPELLERSKLGDADAQYLLGRAYETGSGVQQDLVNAYAWYVIADSSGNARGKDAAKQLTPKLVPSEIASVRSKLGSIYASGAFVPKDYTKSYVWFSLAAAAGAPEGEREKRLLAQKMTEQEIAEADNRASNWLKKHEK